MFLLLSDPPRPSARLRRVLARRWVQVAAVLAVLLVALLVLLVTQALRAGGALRETADEAATLRTAVTGGDVDAVNASVTRLQASAAHARDITDGVVFSIGARLPVVGSSYDATRTVARAADDVARDAVPSLVAASDAFEGDRLRPQDGRFDLAAISALQTPLADAGKTLTRASSQVSALRPDELLGPLRGPVTDLRADLERTTTVVTGAARAADVAPEMLGADGPRRYALLFVDAAAARPGGGAVGGYAIVEADDGRLEVVDQGDAGAVPTAAVPVLTVTREERATWGDAFARELRETTSTADFPRSAEAAKVMLQRTLGGRIDGVVAADPVALSRVLSGTAGIQVAGATLTARTAVAELLNASYRRYPNPNRHERWFALAGRRVFQSLVDGEGDSHRAFAGIAAAAQENRVHVWSADPDVQATLAASSVGGDFSATDRPARVDVAVTDTNGSKLPYWLESSTVGTSTSCAADGVQTLTTTTRLRSTVPTRAGLPSAVRARGGDPRTMRLDVSVFAPTDGAVASMTVMPTSGETRDIGVGDRHGVLGDVELAPGESATVSTIVVTGERATGDVALGTTPGARSGGQDVRVRTSCD